MCVCVLESVCVCVCVVVCVCVCVCVCVVDDRLRLNSDEGSVSMFHALHTHRNMSNTPIKHTIVDQMCHYYF